MVDVVIKDSNGPAARVNAEGQLTTKSIVETQLENTSDTSGLAFSWSSTFATGGTDIEVLSIQNDSSDLDFHIDQVWLAAAAAATFSLNRMTSGTPAGTTITGRPLNVDQGKTAEVTAFGNASVTGSVAGDLKAHILVPASQTILVDLEGAWIYGKDDVFFIGCATNTTIFATVIGHFDED